MEKHQFYIIMEDRRGLHKRKTFHHPRVTIENFLRKLKNLGFSIVYLRDNTTGSELIRKVLV